MASVKPTEGWEDERSKQGDVAALCVLWAEGDAMGRRRCSHVFSEELGPVHCNIPEQFKTWLMLLPGAQRQS